MNEVSLPNDRRSTRLALTIPVIISGVDAEGNSFAETVQTLIVNKHGGKIATTHRLAMGREVLIENRVLAVAAKASVVWLGEREYPGGLRHVGLQLLEAQNIWGIEFPPEDWRAQRQEEVLADPDRLPAPTCAEPGEEETPGFSLAGEEITIRLLQEMQQAANAHAREFQEQLKQLTHRLGMELEFELRERGAYIRAQEVGALVKEVQDLREIVAAAQEQMAKLGAGIQQLQEALAVTRENPSSPSPPLQDARRQLQALAKSVMESMNRAAETGLNDYRNLLQKENREMAARRPSPEEIPLPPGKRAADS